MAKDAEIKLVLNTREAISDAKAFGPQLEKALSVDGRALGNKFIEQRSELLKENLAETNLLSKKTDELGKETVKVAKGLTTKGLDEYDKKLEPILGTVKEMEATEEKLASVQTRIGQLEGKGEGSLSSLKGKIGGYKDPAKKEAARETYNAATQELVNLKLEEADLITKQNQLNATFDTQYSKIKYIVNTMGDVSKAATENKADVEAINATYDALQTKVEETTTATQQGTDAEKQAADAQKQATDSIKNTADAAKNAKESMNDLADSAKDTNEAIKQATSSTENLGNTEKDISKEDPLNNLKTNAQTASNDTKTLSDRLLLIYDIIKTIKKNKAGAFTFPNASTEISVLMRRLIALQQMKRDIEKQNIPQDPEVQRQYLVATIEIDRTKEAIKRYKDALKDAQKENSKTGSSTTAFAKNLKTLSSVAKIVKSGLKSLHGVLKTLKSGFNGLKSVLNKVKSSFNGMASNMKSNFKHLLTSITKYVFGFRSLFFLVRRLRKYLGEGLQNLVQFQGGDNRLNDMISRLLSSLLFLKNAWAAAFEPVIYVVGPILERLIDMVAKAGNAIARFIGALTGQTVVFNAVKVSAGNYAEQLGGVGDSAGDSAEKVKKLTDRLAAFDDLDVLGKDNDDDDNGLNGGGGGAGDMGAGYDDMFEIVDAQSTLADMILEAWKNADFTKVGEYVRDKIYNALMGIDWDFIQEIARKVAKSFGTFLNGLLGDPKLWVAIGHTIAESLNTITYAIDEFLLAIKDTDFGGSFAQGINRMFTDIDWETIKNNIINFFDTLKNNIKSFLAGLNWEDTFISAESGITGEGQAQTGILTAVKTLFEGIGTAIQSVIGDSEFMGEIGAALGNLINAVIVAWQAVCETTDGTEIGNALLEFFRKFFATVKLDILADDITNTINGIVDMLVAQLEGMDGKEMGQTIWDFFERVIDNLDAEDLGKVISQSLVLGLDLITKISEEIAKPENSEKLEEKLKEFIEGLDLSTVFEALGENITASTTAVSSIAATITTVIGSPEVRQAVEDGICALIMSLDIDTIATSVGHVGSAILAAIFGKDLDNPDDLAFLDTFVQRLITGLLVSIDRVLTGGQGNLLANAIFGITDEVAENTDENSPWYEVATNIVTGLFNGIRNAIDAEFKNSPFEIIIIKIKELFKIESPSKVMEEIGEFIVEGLVNGINNLIDTVLEPFNKLKDDLILAWETLKTDAEEKWGLVKDAITGVVETVQTDVEEKWGLIETAVTTAWDNVSIKTQEVWDGMKTKITEEVIPAVSEFITTNLPTIVTTIQTNWETIRTDTETKWELVKGYVIDKFGEAKANLEENLPLFQEFVSTKWEEMSENARIKWDEIKGSIKDKFKEAKEDVINKARELYNKVSGYWDDLKRATYDKFSQIKTSIVNIFEALSRAIKVPLNAFITAIENMVNFAIDGINLLMDALQALMDLGDEALSALGMPEINVTHLEHVSLPRLAQGAVIPPNNEFLAVLGDQSHGTNIEAPLDTIKQAVAEVLANNGNEEVIELLQQLIRVVESKNLTIGDKDIGKANARYTNKQNIIRGTSF